MFTKFKDTTAEWNEGKEARERGWGEKQNPYEDGSDEYEAWELGWHEEDDTGTSRDPKEQS